MLAGAWLLQVPAGGSKHGSEAGSGDDDFAKYLEELDQGSGDASSEHAGSSPADDLDLDEYVEAVQREGASESMS